MSLFDNGGYVKSCHVVYVNELKDCLGRRGLARRFVFDHWRKNRRGYIQVGQPCADRLPVDHIFIEPDADGTYRVLLTLESNGELRTQVASEIKFRKADTEEKQITDLETILVFVDSTGNEIDYF